MQKAGLEFCEYNDVFSVNVGVNQGWVSSPIVFYCLRAYIRK